MATNQGLKELFTKISVSGTATNAAVGISQGDSELYKKLAAAGTASPINKAGINQADCELYNKLNNA